MEPNATRMMNELALWLNYRAEHGEAEPLYLRALAIREKFLGPDQPDLGYQPEQLCRASQCYKSAFRGRVLSAADEGKVAFRETAVIDRVLPTVVSPGTRELRSSRA